MTPYALASAIARAVALDSALQAWATVKFAAAMKCYLGLPSVDFPDMETDAPFIAFGDPGKRRGQETRRQGFTLNAWVGLRLAGYETTAIDNYIEPAGLALICEALELVLSAVVAALPENMAVVSAATETDTLSAHDWVDGYLSIDIEMKITIGSDPMQ